jgi:hypothetical protein
MGGGCGGCVETLKVFLPAAFFIVFLWQTVSPAGVTFLAAAKKVTKESSAYNQTLPLEAASGLTFVQVTLGASPGRPAWLLSNTFD